MSENKTSAPSGGVCPVPHDKRHAMLEAASKKTTVSSSASSPAASTQGPAVCPVPQEKRHALLEAASKPTSISPNSLPIGQSDEPTFTDKVVKTLGFLCPFNKKQREQAAAAGYKPPAHVVEKLEKRRKEAEAAAASAAASTPVHAHHITENEPVDVPDHEVSMASGKGCQVAPVVETKNPVDSDDVVPPNRIPASGRGNSEDGQSWLNPSATQLYRALKRKDKPIEKVDAASVAAVHVAVTENTWAGIMEYEQKYLPQCKNPKLERFSGQDGNYSVKAKLMHLAGFDYPFDRHDWIVNRCGKEVRYIIDYYSFESHGETEFFIDARPAPTFSGVIDRLSLSYSKWKKGEKMW